MLVRQAIRLVSSGFAGKHDTHTCATCLRKMGSWCAAMEPGGGGEPPLYSIARLITHGSRKVSTSGEMRIMTPALTKMMPAEVAKPASVIDRLRCVDSTPAGGADAPCEPSSYHDTTQETRDTKFQREMGTQEKTLECRRRRALAKSRIFKGLHAVSSLKISHMPTCESSSRSGRSGSHVCGCPTRARLPPQQSLSFQQARRR